MLSRPLHRVLQRASARPLRCDFHKTSSSARKEQDGAEDKDIRRHLEDAITGDADQDISDHQKMFASSSYPQQQKVSIRNATYFFRLFSRGFLQSWNELF